MNTPGSAAAGFHRVFGRRPDGIWSAPGRANLIGEFTDYNSGFVLPLALTQSAIACAAQRDDGLIRVASAQFPAKNTDEASETPIDQLAPGSRRGWTAYVLGVYWALRDAGMQMGGVDLFFDSDVPIGAGVSSSAALECSAALALRDLFGLTLSRQALAKTAMRAENEFVGVPTGIMDQIASLSCRAGHAMFLDARDLHSRHVPLELERDDLRLLLVNTGVRRSLDDSAYAKRRFQCQQAAHRLGVASLRDISPEEMDYALARLGDVLVRRARHVISENGRVLEVVRLLEAGKSDLVGPLLTEGHLSLRDDFEVSCVELDTVVESAVASGAFGARMTGGGFGGSAVVLLDRRAVRNVKQSIAVAFGERGFREPEIVEVVASSGAIRIS